MDLAQTLNTADALLRPYAVGAAHFEANRVDVVVKPQDLLAAVRALVDAHWGYLAAITGLDVPWPKTPPKPGAPPPPAPSGNGENPLEDRLEALYHFVAGAAVATLRVSVPYHDPRVPSICPIVPAATLYERELQDMLGFVVEGTPDSSRLLLPDDWPDGLHPLRKSFTGINAPTKA